MQKENLFELCPTPGTTPLNEEQEVAISELCLEIVAEKFGADYNVFDMI